MLQRLFAIIRKELITMLRDPRARGALILPPIIQLFIFSSAATMEVKNISLGVVDLDRGPYAADVLERLRGSRSFARLALYPSVAGARGALEREQVIGILVLPSGFSADRAAARPASAQLLLDGRRSNAASITAQYVSTIVLAAAANLTGAPAAAASPGRAAMPNAEVVVDNWFNPNLDYQWYMLPNLVGMLSLGVALMLTALSVARERELGTFDQTLVSPATPVEIALGKLLPPLLVAIVQATLYLLIVTLFYGVPFRGNLLVFYAAVLAFAEACAGVGLFISSLVYTQQQAFLGAFAVLLPFALLSGFATPVENMPWWLQFITTINPLAHMLRLMQGLFLKGASLASLTHDLVKLVEIALFTTTAAVLLFSRKAA
jgi:ABC-2 type transport system permease protein